MKREYSESLLRVSNVLNLTRQEFSVTEKHIYLNVIAYLKSEQGFNLDLSNDKEVLEVVISPLDLKETNRNRIIEALDKIVSRKVFFDKSSKGNEYYGYLIPIFYAKYEAKDRSSSTITIQIAPSARKLFLELAEGYTSMDIKAIMNLTSGHAIRMYELISMYLNQGSWTVQVDVLRGLFNLGATQYKNFRLFEIYILEYCQKQLWEHCNLHYEWKIAEKKGKKITALTFDMKKRNKQERIELSEEIKATQDYVKGLSPADVSQKANWVKEKYTLTDQQFEYVLSDKNVFNEFIRIDLIIEDMIAKGKPPRDRTKYLAKSLKLHEVKFPKVGKK
jgi:plasmid replication initiation protein